MKKYILIKHAGDIDIFRKHFRKTHIPFVLNIHDFRFFDRQGIPFITVGHILTPENTRRFCRDYLKFLRSFIGEMDRVNQPASIELFRTDLKLFSAVGYNIFWCFYNVFLFIYCLNLMKEEEPCEFVMTVTRNYDTMPDVHWHTVDDYFRMNEDIFSFVTDYFLDLKGLDVTRCVVTKGIQPFRIDDARNSTVFSKEYDKIILNMDPTNLVRSALAGNTQIGLLSFHEALKWGKDEVEEQHLCQNSIKLHKAPSRREFLPFFRCVDFICDALLLAYERILNESVFSVNVIDSLLKKNKILAVLDIAPGDSYIHALLSELARKRKVPVIGMQHGGHYGYMDFFDKLGYCDYYFCDYWLSWGFTTAYLKNTFESSGPSLPVIVPTGSVSIAQSALAKKRCVLKDNRRLRIIYPMVNNVSFLQSAFRINDLKLYYFQKHILEVIIASKAEVWVKPQAGYPVALADMLDHAPCSVSITYDPLSKILRDEAFDWVIMDHLSTPFEEACVMADQILVYNDSVLWPIESHAKDMIRKRAWFFEDEALFLDMLEKLLSGNPFNKKNDNAFEKAFILPYGRDTLVKADAELSRLILNPMP